jgi:hypothetical protein
LEKLVTACNAGGSTYITAFNLVSKPLSDAWSHRANVSTIVLGAFVALAVIGACGPELDAPSSLNLSGHWVSNDNAGALSAIQFDILQNAKGILTGNWSGKFAADLADCPPGIGADPTGPIDGSNTTLLVQFSLLGAGDFDGQVVDKDTVRGALLSCDVNYPMEFRRTATSR